MRMFIRNLSDRAASVALGLAAAIFAVLTILLAKRPEMLRSPLPTATSQPLPETDEVEFPLVSQMRPPPMEEPIEVGLFDYFGDDPVAEATKEYLAWRWQEQVKRIPRPRPRRELIHRHVSDDGTELEAYNDPIDPDDSELAAMITENAA